MIYFCKFIANELLCPYRILMDRTLLKLSHWKELISTGFPKILRRFDQLSRLRPPYFQAASLCSPHLLLKHET